MSKRNKLSKRAMVSVLLGKVSKFELYFEKADS